MKKTVIGSVILAALVGSAIFFLPTASETKKEVSTKKVNTNEICYRGPFVGATYEERIAACTKRMAEGDNTALGQRAFIHYEEKQYDKAIADQKAEIAAFTGNTPKRVHLSARMFLGTLHALTGDHATAVEAFTSAFTFAKAAQDEGEKERKELDLGGKMVVYPDGTDYFKRAESYLMLGKKREAIADLKKARAQYVKEPDAKDYVAVIDRKIKEAGGK